MGGDDDASASQHHDPSPMGGSSRFAVLAPAGFISRRGDPVPSED
jgi:hypothetical protein